MVQSRILVLGVGNILCSDDGIGVRVIERLNDRYRFSDNVSVVDGGVLGTNLINLMMECDRMIVVDAVKGGGEPGTIYRIEESGIPKRILNKGSVHQTDLIEAITLCGLIQEPPETLIFGIEPNDVVTFGLDLTHELASRVDPVAELVLKELVHSGGTYTEKGHSDLFPECPLKSGG